MPRRRLSILRHVMLMLSGISVDKCCRAAGQAKARVLRAEGDRGTKGLRAWHHVLTAAEHPTVVVLMLSGISVEKCCRAAGQRKGRGFGEQKATEEPKGLTKERTRITWMASQWLCKSATGMAVTVAGGTRRAGAAMGTHRRASRSEVHGKRSWKCKAI